MTKKLNALEKYYPQTLLEECKYVITKRKIGNFVTDDLSSGSDSESNSESDKNADK